MAKKAQTDLKHEKANGSSHKLGWLALFAFLSIVGLTIWFVTNADEVS